MRGAFCLGCSAGLGWGSHSEGVYLGFVAGLGWGETIDPGDDSFCILFRQMPLDQMCCFGMLIPKEGLSTSRASDRPGEKKQTHNNFFQAQCQTRGCICVQLSCEKLGLRRFDLGLQTIDYSGQPQLPQLSHLVRCLKFNIPGPQMPHG